jgi:hypothetical protein
MPHKWGRSGSQPPPRAPEVGVYAVLSQFLFEVIGPPGANVGKFSVSCKSLGIKELTNPKTSSILEQLRGNATTPGATREVTYRETLYFFR